MRHHRATGKSVIVSSQEGVTQRDPFFALIRELKSDLPDAKQQWYADDGSTDGKFADIRAQFERLQHFVPTSDTSTT